MVSHKNKSCLKYFLLTAAILLNGWQPSGASPNSNQVKYESIIVELRIGKHDVNGKLKFPIANKQRREGGFAGVGGCSHCDKSPQSTIHMDSPPLG